MLKSAFTSDALFPVEQKVKLSANSATWPETINAVLIRKFPEISSYIDTVTFQELNKTTGDAIGYVTMLNNLFRIPVIVQKFSLLPLDVYVRDNVYGHLSKFTLKKLVSKVWPFKQVNKEDYNSLRKTAAVTLTDKTVGDLKNDSDFIKLANELIDTHPSVVLSLVANLNNVSLLKQASDSKYGHEKVAALEVDNSRTNIIVHHFGKPNEVLSLDEAASRFTMNKIASVLGEGSLFIQLREPMYKTASSYTQFSFDNSFPRTVNMSDNVGGFVRGNIYELFDIKNPEAKKGHIFLSTRSPKCYYKTIFNSLSKDSIYSLAERAILGDIVDDLSRPSGKKGQALGLMFNGSVYGPFEVVAEANMGSERILSIRDGYEYDSKRIHISNAVKRIEVDGDEIFAPFSAKVIWLGEPYNQENPFTKTAAITVTIAASPDKHSFNVTDNGVSGLPSNTLQNLTKTRSIAVLMHCGLTEEESKNAVEEARSVGVYKFSATPTATVSEDETRQAVEKISPEEKGKLEKSAAAIVSVVNKVNLVKLAASYGNEESVDAALGLKLITPTSIKKYRILIPRIEENIDGLCKLLLAKRLGGDSLPVDESKIVTAVSALSEIAGELTGI